ncbi:MAG TPA: STM3941 family protein [Candidatus Binatia bacterium]|jgi:hypothetical protein|nr:STM3941 family protein [Candidatus Binatia bacterium]
MSGRLVVRSSPWRYLLLLAVSLGFVAIGVTLVVAAGHPVVGWLNLIVFGVAAATFLWQIVDRRPRIVIDERGVFDRTLGVGVIPWSDIVGAEIRAITGTTFVALELRDPTRFTRRLPALQRAMTGGNRALGFGELNLNLSGLGVPAALVLARVREGMSPSLAAREQVRQNPPA